MLLSVRRVMAFRVRRRRLVLGALAGGIGSFAVLLPPLPFLLSMLMSMAEAFAMTAAAFAPMSWRRMLKSTIVLFAVSFLYCGIMTAVLSLLSPENLTVRNSVVYIGISPLLLTALTLVCYVLLRLYYSLKGGTAGAEHICQVRIRDKEGERLLNGMIDTGNTLHEPFSGDCVIVSRSGLFGEIPVNGEQWKDCPPEIKKSLRLIPFSSVGGSGLLPAFRPKEMTIVMNNKEIKVSAYLALSSQVKFSDGCDCIVPAELIRKGC